MFYIYHDHHNGGYYISEYNRDYDELYCDICGDSDQFEGQAATGDEATEIIKALENGDRYGEE